MKKYQRINKTKRNEILAMLKQQKSMRQIQKELRQNIYSISREIKSAAGKKDIDRIKRAKERILNNKTAVKSVLKNCVLDDSQQKRLCRQC